MSDSRVRSLGLRHRSTRLFQRRATMTTMSPAVAALLAWYENCGRLRVAPDGCSCLRPVASTREDHDSNIDVSSRLAFPPTVSAVPALCSRRSTRSNALATAAQALEEMGALSPSATPAFLSISAASRSAMSWAYVVCARSVALAASVKLPADSEKSLRSVCVSTVVLTIWIIACISDSPLRLPLLDATKVCSL